jgi:hypothetical protein
MLDGGAKMEMNVTINKFIGIFENAFSKEYCEGLIKDYDIAIEAGFGRTRQDKETFNKLEKADMQLFNELNNIQIPITSVAQFNEVFWGKCYPMYEQEFPALKDSGGHSSYSFKMQKTNLREGYHIWHYESGHRMLCHRLLAWMLYLNDVEEGGETEFLYQSLRVKPKQGTLLIWPAAFTHTHRGNPPLSNPKYVVTGWTEF